MNDGWRWRQFGATLAVIPVLFVVGCRGEEPAAPVAETGAAAATTEATEVPPAGQDEILAVEPDVDEQSGLEVRFGLRADGERDVADPVLSFARGDRVCLAVSLASATPGSELALRWYDAAGEQIGELGATLAGSPSAASRCLPGSEKLGLGSYSVEFELSGSPVGGASFSVADVREVPRRGGA